MIPILRYQEFGMKQIWEFVKKIPELIQYFPDYADGQLPERAYMWNILWTLREDAWVKILETVRKDKSIQAEESKVELIEIHPEILNEILSAPVLSKGNKLFQEWQFIIYRSKRTAFLLKCSRPVRFERSKPKEYKVNLDLLGGEQVQEEIRNPH